MKRLRRIGEIFVFALLLVGFVANAMTITGAHKETNIKPTPPISATQKYGP